MPCQAGSGRHRHGVFRIAIKVRKSSGYGGKIIIANGRRSSGSAVNRGGAQQMQLGAGLIGKQWRSLQQQPMAA